MSHLSSRAEIGIFIGKTIECSLFKQDDLPRLELRKAKSPDAIFTFSPEAVETLLKLEGDEVGDLVAHVAKLYLAGTVKINLPGSIPRLLLRGYVQVLKASHAKILGLLKDHGVDHLAILSLIQKLKSQK
jgi:hypothetical protein